MNLRPQPGDEIDVTTTHVYYSGNVPQANYDGYGDLVSTSPERRRAVAFLIDQCPRKPIWILDSPSYFPSTVGEQGQDYFALLGPDRE